MIDINRRKTIQLIGIGALSSSLFSSPVSAQGDRERVFIKPKRGQRDNVIRTLPAAASDRVQYDNFDFIAITIPKSARRALERNNNIEYVEKDNEVKVVRSMNRGQRIIDSIMGSNDSEDSNQSNNNSRNTPRNNDTISDIEDGISETTETDDEGEVDEEEDEEDENSCEDHPTQSTPWGVKRINADKSEYTGNNINIAILDTGIETNHCSLSVSDGKNFTDSGDENDYEDKHGHGTHVAGTAAALDNGFGVRGVAPESNLYALKVLNDDGAGLQSWMASAIDWCINNDIEIINLSIGSESGSSAMDEVIETAYDNGHMLIASAGNEHNEQNNSCSDNNVLYPAKHKDVIAVSAMDEDDTLASYSSVGSEIEIMAPGTNINSTHINNGYARTSGTSMAAPHVSGVAAQYWEYLGLNGPTRDVGEIRDKINDDAKEILSDCTEGNGLVMSITDRNEEEDEPEEDDEEETEIEEEEDYDEPEEDEPEEDEPEEDEPEEDEPEEDEPEEDEPEEDEPLDNISSTGEEARKRARQRFRDRMRDRVSSWFRR